MLLGLLLMPFVVKVRNGHRCGNQLYQLGVAFHNAHNDFDAFVVDDEQTFYVKLLPYVEQKPAYDEIMAGSPPPPVKTYLCLSRRSVESGPKDDFAAGFHPVSVYGGLDDWRSILATLPPWVDIERVTLQQVNMADGTANTLLLTHKSMRPQEYGTGDEHDTTYARIDTPDDHQRDPRFFVPDSGSSDRKLYLGSPHHNGMPALFADGSVRNVRYHIDPSVGIRLWAWNDGAAVAEEEWKYEPR